MPTEIGIGNYTEIVQNEHIISVLLKTFRLSLVATAFAVAIAYIVAHCWTFASPTGKIIIEVFVLIPFWISALIRAFAWILVLRSDGIINTALLRLGLIEAPIPLVRNEFGVLVGMIHFMIPYALFPIMASFSQVDMRLLLASEGLGASKFRTFWEILFPLTLAGTIAAAIMVFIFCLGFYVTPAVLGGGRVIMAAEYIYQQLFQISNWGLASALSIVMVVLVAALLWLISIVTKFSSVQGK